MTQNDWEILLYIAPYQVKWKAIFWVWNLFFFLQNTTDMYGNATLPSDVLNSNWRRKRTAELSLITSPPSFTATVSDRTLPTGVTASSFQHTEHITNTDIQPTTESIVTEELKTSYTAASHTNSTNIQSSDSAVFGTSAFSFTTVPPATLPPWLTTQSHSVDTTDSSPLVLTPGQLRLSTRDAITGHLSTRSATSSGTTGGRSLTNNTASFNTLQPSLIQAFLFVLALANPVHACGFVYPSVPVCMLQG